jgi:hypothetical protein
MIPAVSQEDTFAVPGIANTIAIRIFRDFGKVEVAHLDWEDGSGYIGKSEVEPNLLNSKGGCI